jgi:hypothetical protein
MFSHGNRCVFSESVDFDRVDLVKMNNKLAWRVKDKVVVFQKLDNPWLGKLVKATHSGFKKDGILILPIEILLRDF